MRFRSSSFGFVLRSTLCGVIVMGGAIRALAAPPADEPPAPNPQLERGKYLTVIGGCNECHTPGGLYGAPDFKRELSGSELGWQGPWGVSYGRNLTPDKDTGLGTWSAEEIAEAIRHGKRPKGSTLLPPMPWPSLSHLTDEDVAAIVAYLKSLPPIHHVSPMIVPPGSKPTGAFVTFPPPPAWDVPPPPAAAAPAPSAPAAK